MSEPTPPDGHQPADPPRLPEQSSRDDTADADATPQRPDRRPPSGVDDRSTVERPTGPPRGRTEPPPGPPAPPADPTVTFVPGAGPGAPPPGPANPPSANPSPPTQPVAGTPPPGYAPAAGFPPGPQYGGAGGQPPGGPPPFGGEPDDGGKKKSGLLVAGLVAFVVLLVGALGFVVTQTGDDAEPATTEEPDDSEPEDAEPPPTEPPPTEPPPTEPSPTSPPATGSVDGVFVHVEARGEVVADSELQAALEALGLAEGNNPVASADPVLNLCAALPVTEPVVASVEWRLDDSTISEGAPRTFSTPADGNCINNNGEPLDSGSYEVSFTDDAGGASTVALFTVGAAAVTQEFLNDTGDDLCLVDVAPLSVGFFQPFELPDGEPLVDGSTIIFDIADIEHEARGVDCNGDALDSVTFLPSVDPISLSSGASVPPTTVPPPQITDAEVSAIDGAVGSLDTVVEPGSADEAVVFEILRGADSEFPIARTDPSLTLCAAWNVPGPLEAEVVWEFNRVEIARIAVTAVDGAIGNCIPPAGAQFDEGAYQVYLQRGDFISQVETYTAGRDQTQLAFRNDTGVAICRVGFSPNLTTWYTFFEFAASADFEGALQPGAAFTIVAPFIENDIQARDCDDNIVSEAFDIPPTDQTLNLTNGQP